MTISPVPRFRALGVDDVDALRAFAIDTFRDTYAAYNTPENLANYLDAAFGRGVLRAQLASDDHLFVVAEINDETAGYYHLRRNGPTPSSVTATPSIELVRFYVDRAWHGRQLAQAQMADTLQRAARFAACCWLGVWDQNARAIRFYEKAGFADAGEISFQLGDDMQSDRLLVIALTPPPDRT